LKEELSSEHARHIEEMSRRSTQETETQLAALRIKYEDEVQHLRQIHTRDLQEKLQVRSLV